MPLAITNSIYLTWKWDGSKLKFLVLIDSINKKNKWSIFVYLLITNQTRENYMIPVSGSLICASLFCPIKVLTAFATNTAYKINIYKVKCANSPFSQVHLILKD
ncbi:hypothetical protein GOODEAATRI_016772 [Goodea atripinnis]|uniref:Uncharacterized protein n=1 Tax=Goodea atripinnis TaxID=208336 RepID=A0ABV0PEM7_9TELE